MTGSLCKWLKYFITKNINFKSLVSDYISSQQFAWIIDTVNFAIDCAKNADLVVPGDKVVITAGVPLNTVGTTNMLKVQIVEGQRN